MHAKLFGCFVLLTFVAVACGPFNSDGKHPSDAALVRRFEDHEDAFNRLVKMSNEDSQVIRVAYDFTRLETNWAWPRADSKLGFTRQRWAEYRKLFNKLGLVTGLDRESSSNGAAIYLVASAKGMTMRGSSKGYVYSEQQITNVVESLDREALQPANSKHGAVYKPIRGHWYLYYDW
jgi:hypothetical protein